LSAGRAFTPTDAVLLQALLYAGALTDGAELRDIVALGDGIRDELFSADELRQGFSKLRAAGFLREEEGRFFVVGAARTLGQRERGSLAQHGEEIAAFLAAAPLRAGDLRTEDPDDPYPELTDERVEQATQGYLESLRGPN
jgi:hypothetical protein